MMITRNTKTRKEDEEENTTAYCIFYHILSKSLFKFTFVSKLWYNIFHNHFPTLSDDIIFFRILNRLPSKTLLRFSCVSKLWYNTIHHDTFFIDSHFNHSKSKPSHVLIYSTSFELNFNFKYLDQENGETSSSSYSLVVEHFKINKRRRQVIDSVNGLTCITTEYFIEVCNPSTHEILGIPYPPTTEAVVYHDASCYGFGFDPVMNQYKVVQVAHRGTDPISQILQTDAICQIFTLGTRAQDCNWRDITVTNHLPQWMDWEVSDGKGHFIFSNGALFKVFSSTNTIIMFDVHYEKFKTIPGPPRSSLVDVQTICEFRGCPYVVYCAYSRGVWEFSFYALIKEESSSNSNVGSNIHFVFEQAFHFPSIITRFVWLSFTEFSGQILVQWFDRSKMQFYVYNPHTTKLQIRSLELSLKTSPCTHLFVNKHIDNLFSLKKLVPLSSTGALATEVKYLSSKEATMYDEGRSSTTLSPMNMLRCFGLGAEKHRQDMNQCDYISRFKPKKVVSNGLVEYISVD